MILRYRNIALHCDLSIVSFHGDNCCALSRLEIELQSVVLDSRIVTPAYCMVACIVVDKKGGE